MSHPPICPTRSIRPIRHNDRPPADPAELLPALSRAKSQASSLSCLNNLKQLETCWHLYAVDHDDHLPPNNFVYDILSDTPVDTGPSWCTNVAPFDTSLAGIKQDL